MAYSDILARVVNGTSVKLVVIGNSIGCAQTANDINGNPVNPGGTQIASGSMMKKLIGTTTTGAVNPNFNGTWPAKGWINQLYTYLKSKNTNSILINESGSGWDTGDHLGGISPNSFGTIPENTINKIVNTYTVKPDIVLVPLQVNDWGHGLGLTWFNTHYAQILDTLIAGLPNAAIVVVIESPVYNRSQVTTNPSNYNVDIVNESGGKYFYDSARSMAQSRSLAIMDLNTGLDTLAKAATGADYGTKLYNTGLMADGSPNYPIHPNQAGHDLMASAAISFFDSFGSLVLTNQNMTVTSVFTAPAITQITNGTLASTSLTSPPTFTEPALEYAKPVITRFEVTGVTGLEATIEIESSDNVGVLAWKVTETPEPPLPTGSWIVFSPPTAYTVSQPGEITLYAWAKDEDNNVSELFQGQPVTFIGSLLAEPMAAATIIEAPALTQISNGTLSVELCTVSTSVTEPEIVQAVNGVLLAEGIEVEYTLSELILSPSRSPTTTNLRKLDGSPVELYTLTGQRL